MQDIGRIQYRWVIAGNQCKPSGSLVLMADGTSQCISKIRRGDLVAVCHPETGELRSTTVEQVWCNGEQETWSYVLESGVTTQSTANHEMLISPSINVPEYTKQPIHFTHSLLRRNESGQVVKDRIVDRRLMGLRPVYDITVADPSHTYVCDGLITGNSGKSSLAARELAWVIEDKHPWWKKPKEWGAEPLLAIIAGQDRKMMEIEMWYKKLKPLLNQSDWKEIRVGGSLQYVENRVTQARILFVSHNDSSDKNRVHMQGYVAHYVWLDELPTNIKILEELQRRVDARRGYFIATFTPKIRSDSIRRVVDSSQEPLAKVYRMSKLDNPLYAERREEEMQKLDGYPESYRNTILYGDWYTGDNAVYYFDRETHIQDPPDYSPGWRHVEAVDPATQSKFGFTIWAECPSNGIWYCVRADYISGILVPEDIFQEVRKRTQGLNIVRRICDPEASWYINTASSHGVFYQMPNKNNRKGEMIKNLQGALGSKARLSTWVTDLHSEFETCQWAESGSGKIVNGSSYHLLDCAQYFIDCKPTSIGPVENKTWIQELVDANQARKVRKFRQEQARTSRIKRQHAWHRR